VLAVSQRMGHSDPSVTLREYGHLIEGAQQRRTDDLDGLREATATAPTEGAIVDLDGHRPGHEQDTRDTEKDTESRQTADNGGHSRLGVWAVQRSFWASDLL
jgi:hypothetical protein